MTAIGLAMVSWRNQPGKQPHGQMHQGKDSSPRYDDYKEHDRDWVGDGQLEELTHVLILHLELLIEFSVEKFVGTLGDHQLVLFQS